CTAIRRAEDGAPRPPRPRLVEGGRGHAGVARAHRLGSDPQLRACLGPAAAPAMKQFEGASVLVTGGSRGIGREIARTFAERGAARVAIGYMRSDSAAEETAAELRGLGAETVLLRGNVASSR